MFLLYLIGWWIVGIASIFATAVFINWIDGSVLRIKFDHVIWGTLGGLTGLIATAALVILVALVGVGYLYEYTKKRYGEDLFTFDFGKKK